MRTPRYGDSGPSAQANPFGTVWVHAGRWTYTLDLREAEELLQELTRAVMKAKEVNSLTRGGK